MSAAHDFEPGDHLRVRRSVYHTGISYYHHGIYVGDDCVVQFGGVIFDKPHARIEEVPLWCFLRGGRAEIVDQSKLTWIRLWKLPPPLPRDRIVARARCLAVQGSEGTYNLVGRNCETVALWCVCGMGESLQRQRFQAGNAVFGVLFALWTQLLAARRRGGYTRGQLGIILSVLATRSALLVMYYRHNKRFYEGARACDHL